MIILNPGGDTATRQQGRFSPSPVTRFRLFALVAACASLLAACAPSQQITATRQASRGDAAAIDVSRSSRTPLGMVVTWTRSIVARLPYPETTKWERMLANADGSIVCLEFNAQDDTRGYSHQRVAFVDGVASNVVAVWERNCTQGLYNMASAEYLIASR